MMKSILYMIFAVPALVLVGCNPADVNSPVAPNTPDTVCRDPVLVAPDGAFSISQKQFVRFASGNLQYNRKTDTWTFATHQYDIIGKNNLTGYDERERYGTSLAEKIDLFGWSDANAGVKWGVGILESDYADCSGEFADWGQNIGDGKTWRTLTAKEWDYIFQYRSNADSLIGVIRISLNESSDNYVNGLILLPDTWKTPEGITIRSGFPEDRVTHQTFTLDEWQRLESAGAVFLPAAGYRSGYESNDEWKGCIEYVQGTGRYWSASSTIDHYGDHVFLDIYAFQFSAGDYIYFDCKTGASSSLDEGCAVRLVRDF